MSRERVLVDWAVAERVAATVVGGLGPLGSEPPDRSWPDADRLREVCAEALGLAEAYAGLGAVANPPAPELVDRREWAQNALGLLADAAAPLEERMAGELRLPSPLDAIARGLLGGAAGAEAGLAVGYAARRVIGQYDVAVFGPERPGRLLFVGENMAATRRDLDADPELFMRWIALHECTHVIQLEQVDWLLPHLRKLAGEVLENAAATIEASALRDLGRRLVSDPREFMRTVMRGELARTLASPEQRARLDRIQATMTVVEGHAEHVMDSAAPQLGPGVRRLRRALERRRENRSWLGEVIGRLLGLDLKLRQYALGRAFCNEIVERAGPEALTALWRSPEGLPTLAELEDPPSWLARVGLGTARAA